MSAIALSGNGVPAPRSGDDPDRDGDAVGTGLPAGAPAGAGGTAAPPPVRPTIVLAGTGQRDLAERLLGVPLPAPAPGAYLALRHGRPGTRAFIPGHRAPRGGYILAASAADLMSEHTADQPADNCTRDVRAASVIDDLLAFHPAAILRWAQYRPCRRHLCLIERFIRPLAILVGGGRHRRRRLIEILRGALQRAN